MIVDFRKINEKLEYWFSVIMQIDRIISKLHNTKLFSTLDIRFHYYNIMAAENNRKYTLPLNMESMDY